MKLLPIGTKVVATREGLDSVKIGDTGVVVQNDTDGSEYPNLINWGGDREYWTVPYEKLKWAEEPREVKKLKKGDKAVVTGNLEEPSVETGLCPHGFGQGTVVTLRHKYSYGWRCTDSAGDFFTVREEDLKKFKKAEEPKEQRVLLADHTYLDPGYTEGAVVTVLGRDDDGTVLIAPIHTKGNCGGDGDGGWWVIEDELGEQAPEEKPKQGIEPLKVGTRVVVTESSLGVKEGERGTVVRAQEFCEDELPNKIKWDSMAVPLWSVAHKELKERKKGFKVGDKVRVVAELCGHEFDIGQEVTIREVTASNYKVADDNDSWFVMDEEIEKVKTKKTKTKKFKAGDKVRLRQGAVECDAGYTEGAITTVMKAERTMVLVEPIQSTGNPVGDRGWWLALDKFEKVKKPKLKGGFKPGDQAEIAGTTPKANGSEIGPHLFEEGQIVTLEKWDRGFKAWVIKDEDFDWLVYPCDLKKVKKPEGMRKEFENFEVGDIVITTKYAIDAGKYEKGTKLTIETIDEDNFAEFKESPDGMFILSEEPRFFKWVEEEQEPVDRRETLLDLNDNTILGALFAQHALWAHECNLEKDYPEYFVQLDKVLDDLADKHAAHQEKLV